MLNRRTFFQSCAGAISGLVAWAFGSGEKDVWEHTTKDFKPEPNKGHTHIITTQSHHIVITVVHETPEIFIDGNLVEPVPKRVGDFLVDHPVVAKIQTRSGFIYVCEYSAWQFIAKAEGKLERLSYWGVADYQRENA